jgi:hypothetical protein
MRLRLQTHLQYLTVGAVVLLGTTGALIGMAGGTLGASAACGCELKRVKVEPKVLAFAELAEGVEETRELTFTNEGPGPFTLEGALFDLRVGEGLGKRGFSIAENRAEPCNAVAVDRTCKPMITFRPMERGKTWEGTLVTNPLSEDVTIEGKSRP